MEYEAVLALNDTTDFTCDQVCTDQIRPLGVDLQTELFSGVVTVIKSICLSDTIRKKGKLANKLEKRVTFCSIFITKWKKACT